MSTTIILDPVKRFSFGKNWLRFLQHLTEARILEAEKSLQEKLGVNCLKGKVFLDVGSGSGLFSLAAYRLGATVYSFDYDIDSVNCTRYLQEVYAKYDKRWVVVQGSILDQKFLQQFAPVDILYSWGVLHHTGHMYDAFANVATLVKEEGKLFISIYNDQGGASKRWRWLKECYNNGFLVTRVLLCLYTIARNWTITFVKDFYKFGNPLKTWFQYSKDNRGMSAWHDVVDWIGGYPFEVAKPEDIFDFFKARGFILEKLKTCAGGIGCNEFVFRLNKQYEQ